MGIFNSINETSNKALHSGQVYAEVSKKYYKLKAFQQLAKSFTFLSKLAIVGGIFFLCVIFLLISATLWLGKAIGSFELACLLMSISLFILTTIVYLSRKQIDKILIRKLSKDFFD